MMKAYCSSPVYRDDVLVIIIVCSYTANISNFKIYSLHSYLLENTVHLHYKNKLVNAV